MITSARRALKFINKVRKKMKKNNNNVKSEVINNNNHIDVAKVNMTQHNASLLIDFFADTSKEVDKVITVNMSKLNCIDVMRLSFVDVVRKLVKLDCNFTLISRYVYNFYNKTNDRSKSKREDKHDNLVAYAQQRAAKQLRDVLKEAFAVKKFNKIMSVSEYKKEVK